MKTPDVSCKIDAFCSIHPSEDTEKVKQALSNILVYTNITINKESIKVTSSNLESLQKIYESIHLHQSANSYRRQLNQNLNENSSWFYLNKQAAYSNIVALCSESDESPLGPIKIVLNSSDIDRIIDWLTFNHKQ